ncbi:MAG: fumarate hydratase class II [Arenicella sp.]|jgi:fumarate hydratase class II
MNKTGFRLESDSLGTIDVPAEVYWGAQTQRALAHFAIGAKRFRWGRIFIQSLGLVKKAAVQTNADLGGLPTELVAPMVQACDDLIDGKLDGHFPLAVFHSGSGTQTNMNANEVIANRAIEIMAGQLGNKNLVHPNDHVNCSQSSNDVFPTAMYLAAVLTLKQTLLPALNGLRDTLNAKAEQYSKLVKVGRTHLQDAAPLTLGQEMSAWVAQMDFAIDLLNKQSGLYQLAIGGTAVGTGMNASADFGDRVAQKLSHVTGLPFVSAASKFSALAAHDALVHTSANLRLLSSSLLKIANDIRWLASGPRCGIGELQLPANEPGSSIMPGKVNPSQCEAMTMVCAQVFGNDACVAFAGSQGNFQLNVFKPVMIHNVLESMELLADACISFDHYCARGLLANEQVINHHLQQNLMLVTGLAPHIGYDKAAKIAALATEKDLSLKEAALKSGFVTEEEFKRWIEPLMGR